MIGKELGESVVSQKDVLFPDMDEFYFLEPTQKENHFDLYMSYKKNEEIRDAELIATIYQYETARVIMNSLNEKLREIGNRG